MDHSVSITTVVLLIVFSAGTIITLGIVWQQQRTKNKGFEVLKTYAEKGQEPPASVLEAVHRINWPFPPPPLPRRPTRGEHLSHVAGSVVLAIGAAGVAWWRSQLGEMGGLTIIAVIVAIFCAGAAAARLVAALTTRDER